MFILIVMLIGVFIGSKYFPQKWHGYNSKVQIASIVMLIFCMGVSLGSNPEFMQELGVQGIKGLLFAIIPILCSILVVYVLTHKFLQEKDHD